MLIHINKSTATEMEKVMKVLKLSLRIYALKSSQAISRVEFELTAEVSEISSIPFIRVR
jgi:hypothetical protein